ncbi:MAG: NAD(P)H-dependent oxidoreductase [Candidatus Zapsychrus exili]|nr:NAD(P)H-dependent oxidoreductase [Candidatus Zapsychrus exili]
MKISIIFHSVCGNDYLVAKEFYNNLKKKSDDSVSIYRVEDLDWKEQADVSQKAKENLKEMNELPIASPSVMLDSDLVIIGSPTYFGNVSAEMKIFMDSVAIYWFEAKLAGKKIVAFTSAGNTEGGGSLTLAAINTFGQYMGMLPIPVPTNTVAGQPISAYGIIHYSSAKYGESLDDKTIVAVDKFTDYLLKL